MMVVTLLVLRVAIAQRYVCNITITIVMNTYNHDYLAPTNTPNTVLVMPESRKILWFSITD